MSLTQASALDPFSSSDNNYLMRLIYKQDDLSALPLLNWEAPQLPLEQSLKDPVTRLIDKKDDSIGLVFKVFKKATGELYLIALSRNPNDGNHVPLLGWKITVYSCSPKMYLPPNKLLPDFKYQKSPVNFTSSSFLVGTDASDRLKKIVQGGDQEFSLEKPTLSPAKPASLGKILAIAATCLGLLIALFFAARSFFRGAYPNKI